jgi:hypothetical protein
MSAPSLAAWAGSSEVLNSPPKTFGPSGSLNAKPTAKQSSLPIGPVSPSTRRSKGSRRKGRINRLHPNWSPEGFHANLSARLESIADLLTHAGSGRTLSGSFATFDRDTSLWRTCRSSAKKPSKSSQPTWPRSGIAFGGTASRLAGLGLHTYASGSSSLPTLTASGAPNRNANAKLWGEAKSIQEMARTGKWPDRLPTLRSSPNENRQRHTTPSQAAAKHGRSLLAELNGRLPTLKGIDGTHPHLHPSPTYGPNLTHRLRTLQAANANQGAKSQEFYEKCLDTNESMITLTDQVGGLTNPTWAEWFMGFPPNWTAVEWKPSATRSSRKPQKSSAGSSSNAKRGD